MTRFAKLIAPALALALAVPAPADACHRRKARRCVSPPRCAASAPWMVVPAYPVAPSPQTAAPAAGDPLSWLNAQRAALGLRPLAWDAGLAADAARNSAAGFGHATRGYGRGQVVGMGPLAVVQAQWLASASHYAILMDPHATAAGFGGVGPVWTISLN